MSETSSQNLSKMLPIRMKGSTYAFFEDAADERDRSMAWVIRRILEAVEEADEDVLSLFLEDQPQSGLLDALVSK